MAVVFIFTLNLLRVSSCKMFTFCDVLHEKKLSKLLRVRSTDWKSSLKYNVHIHLHVL